MPKYIFMIKASPMAEDPPANVPTEVFESMGKINEEMNAAGVLLGANGLRPTSDGYRVKYSTKGVEEVIPGPFDVTTEVHICGWWVVQTKDDEEALSWAKRLPFQMGEITIRRIAAPEDLGDGFTKELLDKEAKLRLDIAERVRDLAAENLKERGL